MKINIIVLVCFLSGINCFSQNYYIKTNNDSVSCKEIKSFETNSQGKLVELQYIDKEGKEIKQKKSDMPDIRTFCMNGVIYDRMPLKIEKPDSYYRYGERVVNNGKIRINVYDNQQTKYELRKNFDGTSTGQGSWSTYGTYLRHVKMPDGTIYEVSGIKGMKAAKKIRDYMFECKDFEKECNSNPKYKSCTFEETVYDYNKMCK